jgi:class 3 adenylate cyclase
MIVRWIRRWFAREPVAPAVAPAAWSDVTVLAVTVVGFQLADADAVAAAAAPEDYRELAVPIARRYGGRLVSVDADAIDYIFDTAAIAVDAARAIVAAWVTRRGGRQGGVTLGVGLASGPVVAGSLMLPGDGGAVGVATGAALRDAGRLAGLGARTAVAIVVCAETARRLDGRYGARPLTADGVQGVGGTAYELVAR